MTVVPLAQAKNGSRLSEDVFTKRGNLLLEKGKVIHERERQLLHAFMITSIPLENGTENDLSEMTVDAPSSDHSSTLDDEIKVMKDLLKRVFNLIASGQPVPILEIRLQLIRLLDHIDEFQVLLNEKKDIGSDYLFINSIYVAMTSYLLSKWHGLPQKDWLPVALGGLLHNIGHAKVDASIFERKEKLTAEERDHMQKHTLMGYQIMKNVPAVNEGVKYCTLQHHEREDGSGYPMGVTGDRIHPYAKIVAIADIYQAMISNRSYKSSQSPYLVLDQLWEESFGKLDPTLVQTFIIKVTSFSKGNLVKLNDGSVGEIVFFDRDNPTRPWVKVGENIINLVVERKMYIQEVLTR